MRIFVMNTFWDAHELWVLPSDSISSLRAAIMDEFGLTEEKIKERLLVLDDRNLFRENPPTLLANGCDLFEQRSTTLDACGIKADSTLRLGWKGPFLLAIATDSEYDYVTEEIKVSSCYDTIESLTTKVKEVTEEPVTMENFPRVLLSQEHRTLLSLGYYKLSENGHPKPRIYRHRDDLIPTTAKPDYNGEYILAPGFFQITIEIPNLPLRLPLLCMPAYKIEDLKCHIAGTCMRDTRLRLPDYLIKSQFVLFLHDTELDDDSATLKDCGIQHMDSLKLFQDASFLLDIRSELHNFHQFDVQFKCFHTIDKLKVELQNLTAIPKDEFQLTYKQWRLDDNDRHFLDYVTREMEPGFHPTGDLIRRIVIHLSLHSAADDDEQPMPNCRKLDPHRSLPPSIFVEKWIQIVVELPNMPWRFPLNVKPTSTIADVKWAIINRYLEDAMLLGQRYIKEGKFVLVCGRKDLENESMTLADYGIRDMGSIQLLESSCFGITISAPCLGLRGYVLEMRCFDTVRMLKEKLWKVGRIDKEKKLYVAYTLDCFRLVLFLEDDGRRLIDYGIAKQVEYDESLVSINPKIHRSWNLRKERHRICVSPCMRIAQGPLFMSSLYG